MMNYSHGYQLSIVVAVVDGFSDVNGPMTPSLARVVGHDFVAMDYDPMPPGWNHKIGDVG